MDFFRKLTFIFLVSSLMGMSKGDFVELESFFNGRYSANFTRSANNIKFVLPKGTQGKIEETQRFRSGNYGLKIEVTEGPRKGEKVWVHYNVKSPNIKLFANESDLKKGVSQKTPESAAIVRTIASVQAFRAPRETSKAEKAAVQELVTKIGSAQKALREKENPGASCSTCSVFDVYARDNFQMKTSEDTPSIRAPERDANPKGIRSTRCRSDDHDVDFCVFEGDREPGMFKFHNRGPNRVVSPGESRSRLWSFSYESNARQDLSIWLTDSPNAFTSQSQESILMFFPRKSLFTNRVVGNRQIVTLPTGETVTFDKRTKEVVGGVLTEDGPLTSGGKTLSPAKVTYRGAGIMVRVDSRGSDPRLQKNGNATISKMGRTCKVPAKELWPDQSEASAAHFRFSSDAAFDSYIKSRCGFGIF